MKTLLRLSALVAPLFPVMAAAVILGTAGFLCAIGIPLFASLALTVRFPLYWLIAAGVLRGVLHYAEQYCNHFIAFTLLARIRGIVFDKLRALGPAKLDGKRKGELISLLTSDIELLELFYAHTISPVCIATLTSAIIAAILAAKSAALGILALVFYALVAVGVPLAVRKGAMRAGAEHRRLFAEMNAFLLDSLRGLQQTILFGGGEKKLREIKARSENLSASKRQSAVYDGLTAALIDSLVIAAAAAMLLVSLSLFRAGKIDFGTVIFAVTAMFSSFAPVIAVARLGSSLAETVAAGNRVLSLLDEKSIASDITAGSDICDFDEKTGDFLSAKDVCFSYKNGEEGTVLRDISVSAHRRGIVGIQGKSGSGKSTLLKLFMRFYLADSGEISVGGNDINAINTASLRAAESYVTQDTVLFHDTIENNVRIARLDATREEIEEACRKANIHDFIASLPNGYETTVAELGDNFSGGERQRLGLARAFLHESKILLLDEPTSNLDSYNESVILQSVQEAAKDKAVILVSHRESTLGAAEKIYKIESGRQS